MSSHLIHFPVLLGAYIASILEQKAAQQKKQKGIESKTKLEIFSYYKFSYYKGITKLTKIKLSRECIF